MNTVAYLAMKDIFWKQ